MAVLTESLPGFDLLPRVTFPIWGIDPSTKRIALARLEPDVGGTRLTVDTLPLAQPKEPAQRLARAHAALPQLFGSWREHMEAGTAPSHVYVEQPFATVFKGKPRVHPQSYFMVGIVLAVLAQELYDTRVCLIDPPSWKCRALGKGHGHAKKPEILEWAKGRGYAGESEDEADAIGIAVAGAILSAE